MILSIGSPFFEKVLQASSQAQPCLYLKGVDHEDLVSAIQFMYGGEVEMTQDRLHKFIGVSQELQIKGFTDVKQVEHDSAIDVDNSMLENEGDDEAEELAEDIVNEIVAAMVEEIVEVMVDESLGEEQKTIDGIISDKLIKDNANSFRCKECNFTHRRRDVTRDHTEEHHLNTGGVECRVCHKVRRPMSIVPIFKNRPLRRQHVTRNT